MHSPSQQDDPNATSLEPQDMAGVIGCCNLFKSIRQKSNNPPQSLQTPRSAGRSAGIFGKVVSFRFRRKGLLKSWRKFPSSRELSETTTEAPQLTTSTMSSPDIRPEIERLPSAASPIAESSGPRKAFHEPKLLPESNLYQSLQKWNARHREGTVNMILQKISTFLESRPVVAVLEAIPDSPLMTATIVRSVSALVIFGINTPRRKRDACNFALQVLDELRYMSELLSAESSEDPTLLQCRRDLGPFCAQVDAIGQWVYDQLTSTFASHADEEREDFRQKLQDSNVLFLKLSTIRMIRSLSTIGQDVAKLLNSNERESQLKVIMTAFEDNVATHYQYSAQGKQECDPTTRNIVLAKIDDWVRSATVDDRNTRCWWITGIAGIGKTAIAITTAQCLIDRRPISAFRMAHEDDSRKVEAPLLCAQYFFNHLLPDTANVNHLFPTLAFQLASTSPIAACIIQEAIKDEPTVVNRFSFQQARAIFLKPLVELARVVDPKMLVIVIDGLDELQPIEGETLPHFFAEFTSVLAQVVNDVPWNVRVLILSRPQAEIIEGITPEIFRYHLDANDSQRDVRRYLTEQLTRVGHDTRHSNFPTLDQLDRLCDAANGHLGWAKQAVVWIKRRLQVSNGATINDDIKRLGKLAHGDLNSLYHHTLMSLLPPDEVLVTYYSNGLRRVLRILTVLREPQSIGTICEIAKAEDDFNVRNCLMELSGLYASTESITDNTIPQPHKSFYDFLTSQYTLPPFRVEIPAAHHELAEACFRVMRSDHLHFNMGGFDSPHLLNRYARSRIPKHVHYACTTFVHHLQECESSARLALSDIVHLWAQEKLNFWIEVMSLLGYMHVHEHDEPQAIQMIQVLSAHFPDLPILNCYLEFIRKAASCGIADSAPSLYIAALPFSDVCPTKQACVQVLPKKPGYPLSVVSDYSRIFAISSERVALLLERRIYFLSLQTGTRQALDFDFASPPIAISLSADNRTLGCLTSTRYDDELRIEMVLFRAPSCRLETRFHLDPGGDEQSLQVRSLHLSPHANQVAVLFGNRDDPVSNVYLYNSSDGGLLWRKEINGVGISFLSEDSLIAVTESRLCLFSTTSGQLWSDIGDRVQGFVHCIDVSPTDAIISVRTDSSVLRMWNYDNGRLHGQLCQKGMQSTCFSPDGDFLALGIRSVIHMWSCAVDPWRHIATLHGHFGDVTGMSFSANEDMLLSVSSDGTIRLWDIRAILEEKEFTVQVVENGLAVGTWFKHCIPLGGWYRDSGEHFIFQYPFEMQGPEIAEAHSTLTYKPLPWQGSLHDA